MKRTPSWPYSPAAAERGGPSGRPGGSDRPAARAATDARTLLATAAAAFLAVACAVLPPKPLPPRVSLAQVRVASVQAGNVALRVTLDVDNPNGYPLALAAIDAAIAVNGVRLADVALATPVTLPATLATKVDFDVATSFDRALDALRRSDGGPALPYELAGTAVLGDGTRLPFVRRGTLPLPEWARMLAR